MASVLVIDDDDAIRNLVQTVLVGAGHSVRVAADGREGLDQFQGERPDLVITDMVAPGNAREGIETIEAMRARDPTVPIIATSGSGHDEVSEFLDAARNAGTLITLDKPFRMSALVKAVNEVLEQGRLGR